MILPAHLVDKQTYIIRIGGLSDTVCKIGKSSKPQKRLRQLQGSNPFKLQMISTFVWDIEDSLHRLFEAKGDRLQGEWFRIHTKDLDEIVSYLSVETECINLEYHFYKTAANSSRFLDRYEELEWAYNWRKDLQKKLNNMRGNYK